MTAHLGGIQNLQAPKHVVPGLLGADAVEGSQVHARGGEDNLILGGEVIVDSSSRQAGGGDDLAHRGLLITVLDEAFAGGLYNLRTPVLFVFFADFRHTLILANFLALRAPSGYAFHAVELQSTKNRIKIL